MSAGRHQILIGLLLIAVSCTHSVSTCFCTSMGTGPEARSGFDLALTELDGGFVVRCGSSAGRDLLEALPVVLAQERHGGDGVAARLDNLSQIFRARHHPHCLEWRYRTGDRSVRSLGRHQPGRSTSGTGSNPDPPQG